MGRFCFVLGLMFVVGVMGLLAVDPVQARGGCANGECVAILPAGPPVYAVTYRTRGPAYAANAGCAGAANAGCAGAAAGCSGNRNAAAGGCSGSGRRGVPILRRLRRGG